MNKYKQPLKINDLTNSDNSLPWESRGGTSSPLRRESKGIYFDNTATSFPKPDNVVEALTNYVNKISAPIPDVQAICFAIEAGGNSFNARRELASMFGVKIQ